MSTKVPNFRKHIKPCEYFRKKYHTARHRLQGLINRRRQLPDPEEIDILPMWVGLAAQIRTQDYARSQTNAEHIAAVDAIASQVVRATKYTLALSDAATSDDYDDEYEYEIVYYLYGTTEDHNQGAIFVKLDNSLMFDQSCLGLGFSRGTIHCGYLSNARNEQSSYPITRDCIDCQKSLRYPYDVDTQKLAKPTVKFCPVFYLNEPNRAHARFEYSDKSYCFWDEITQDWTSASLTRAQCRELLADYDDEY